MLTDKQNSMIAAFTKHVAAEVEGDLDTTLATMSDTPHLHSVPTMMGGYGKEGVRDFYRDHLIGQFFPPDLNMERVSITVDENQLVEELVINFTHTQKMNHMLPGIAPTGKKVEIAVVVIVGFVDGKISHEHIYWDQASVLVQLGLLDPSNLPVVGSESARRVLNPSLPPRSLEH